MLRYSGERSGAERRSGGKAESRKDKMVEGWGRLSRQARVKTGWGIGYDWGYWV